MLFYVISRLLKTQHNEIKRNLSELETYLAQANPNLEQVEEAKIMLRALDQRVALHLAQEDNILYPKLVDSSNDEIRGVARRFVEETGSLVVSFNQYVSRWTHGRAIDGKWALFLEETAHIVGSLRRRIEKEEAILFPMIDRME